MDEINEKKSKNRLVVFLVVTFIMLVTSTLLYFSSDISNVKSVKVINNTFLSDEYIKEFVGINDKSKYLLIFKSNKISKAKNNPLIKSLNIDIKSNRSVIIEVQENQIIGYSSEFKDGFTTTYLILNDGERIEFDSSYIKNLALLPLIDESEKANIIKVASALKEVNFEILSRISEVKIVNFTYDEMLEIITSDGYRMYISLSDAKKINYYLDIIVNDTNKEPECILFLEDYDKAVIVKCDEIENYLEKES